MTTMMMMIEGVVVMHFQTSKRLTGHIGYGLMSACRCCCYQQSFKSLLIKNLHFKIRTLKICCKFSHNSYYLLRLGQFRIKIYCIRRKFSMFIFFMETVISLLFVAILIVVHQRKCLNFKTESGPFKFCSLMG